MVHGAVPHRKLVRETLPAMDILVHPSYEDTLAWVLLEAQAIDTLDQALAYPKKGPAQVSSDILTLEPGQETGWHRHRVPQFVYVLEGSLSVEYDAGVVKEYPAGTAYLEAEDIWHNATNKGDDAVRTLVVYMGAEGARNTVERPS